ncbi:MAG: hypothetical protein A2521_17290 [Deltaproteobacteria bacterium RIFOXYD12_FULL_57_12]|nr:MAG: hypothetical protein A2521_17290 [Deltaproteobacteria bacterium RIFOXYD12_FULL_57_12]
MKPYGWKFFVIAAALVFVVTGFACSLRAAEIVAVGKVGDRYQYRIGDVPITVLAGDSINGCLVTDQGLACGKDAEKMHRQEDDLLGRMLRLEMTGRQCAERLQKMESADALLQSELSRKNRMIEEMLIDNPATAKKITASSSEPAGSLAASASRGGAVAPPAVGDTTRQTGHDAIKMQQTRPPKADPEKATVKQKAPAVKPFVMNAEHDKESGEAIAEIIRQQEKSSPSLQGEPIRHEGDATTIPGHYPEASTRLLTEEDLKGRTAQEVKVMRNEIFARHSYIFRTEELRVHFEAQPWYRPQHKDVKRMLTGIEKANIELLRNYKGE